MSTLLPHHHSGPPSVSIEHRIMMFTAIRRPPVPFRSVQPLSFRSATVRRRYPIPGTNSARDRQTDNTQGTTPRYEDVTGAYILHTILYLFDYDRRVLLQYFLFPLQQYYYKHRRHSCSSSPVYSTSCCCCCFHSGSTCTYIYVHVSQLSTLLRDCRNIVRAPCLEY